MDCDFDDALKCRNCGYVARRPGTRRTCGIHGPEPLEMVTGYARAVAEWVMAGGPTRDDAEIARILAICEQCPTGRYDGRSCKVCGCNVNSSSVALVNKLAMATQSCPEGHW